MIDHFEIKVQNFEECKAWYESVLKELGVEVKWGDSNAVGFGKLEDNERVLMLIEKSSVNTGKYHIAFEATSEKQVNDFYEAGMHAGGIDNGTPGSRPNYGTNYYACFIIDPEGNNVEAVFRGGA